MSDAILQTRNLAKTFKGPDGEIRVLESVDLSVSPSESVSIRGESGAGKTTLLYLISALEIPNQGELFWEGEDVLKKSITWRARRRGAFMGFVFQAYYLIPELNALENVIIAKRLLGRVTAEDKKRAKELLERVGLKDRLKHMSGQLSGGERQRIAVARALINRPSLILADEPTGNLDEHTGDEMMDLLLGLCEAEQTSLVLVTHNPEFAKRTDRQLFLRAGEMQKSNGHSQS
ncbi:ABC transporter ATP-binding protein [Rubellicoccus peritrichatus]|uniref:ABC transporter ATP-binding protein n=1 Tax=Rubellicoccus peritrichatus TaxID=3080537 RepID=A0AAQ3QTZ3_9BACT|nr:ABC transporter ATP-binding protein [Puniceicoccus sp. CR14]WOO41866.1 ABC transporter ATP-binding protein [Puniceicoccus sp. CR14]